jgi:addiction module HigA family antidote
MPMKNPSHPGSILRYDCLEPLGLSVTEAAKVLRVSRQTLNYLVNGKAGVSAEMAVRLSKAFGSEPEFWLRLQMNYALAEVRRRGTEIDVKRFKKAS